MSDAEAGRCSFLGRPVPPGFETRRIVLDCGARQSYDESEWQDAIVVVEEGEIELECLHGSRHRFARGDVFWLVGLPLRLLHCSGPGPAVLITVSRSATDEFPASQPSERE